MVDSTPMKRRWLAPAVLQVSPADSARAALQSIAQGFGQHSSVNRMVGEVRADTIPASLAAADSLARLFGITCVRWDMPSDGSSAAMALANLPAIAVRIGAEGVCRCVVLWRKWGPWVQVMDPAVGRRWLWRSSLQDLLTAIDPESSAAPWSDAAHQAAAVRMGEHLRRLGHLAPEEFADFYRLCALHPADIPAAFWAAGQSAPQRASGNPAVLLRISAVAAASDREVRRSIWAPVWSLRQAGGWQLPAAGLIALSAVATGTVLEALLFRGLFDLGRHLPFAMARLAAMGAVLLFLALLLALDWPATQSLFRVGRCLEVQLRTRLLQKIPRLGDRHLQARPVADVAFRAHSLQLLRQLPEAVGYGTYLVSNLLVTAFAIHWMYSGTGVLIGLAVICACGVPALFAPAMTKRDLRYREASAALNNGLLDSMLGSHAIRAHGAQSSIRVSHGLLRKAWSAAALHVQALYVVADAAQMIPTYACIVGLVYAQVALVHSPAGLLLLIYWAMSIPLLGRDLATLVRRFPAMHNTLLRYAEIAAAPEESVEGGHRTHKSQGVKIDMRSATVVVAGNTLLDRITLHVSPGEHVAIVGKSGAGKSSLVGCLLGWHPPGSGSIAVDDEPLDAAGLAQLRQETAWIDPQVHVFNGTLLDNLRYGNGQGADEHAALSIELTDLGACLERQPDGLQTNIGEGGSAISEGEAQRLRIARALGRPEVRLAILDEPVRGLGRPQRLRYLDLVRGRFKRATLLCITHDVADALEFDRVLVVDGGRIVEQGAARALLADSDSRFRQLYDEEALVARELWGHPDWRSWLLQDGTVREVRAVPTPADLVRDAVGRRTG